MRFAAAFAPRSAAGGGARDAGPAASAPRLVDFAPLNDGAAPPATPPAAAAAAAASVDAMRGGGPAGALLLRAWIWLAFSTSPPSMCRLLAMRLMAGENVHAATSAAAAAAAAARRSSRVLRNASSRAYMSPLSVVTFRRRVRTASAFTSARYAGTGTPFGSKGTAAQATLEAMAAQSQKSRNTKMHSRILCALELAFCLRRAQRPDVT